VRKGASSVCRPHLSYGRCSASVQVVFTYCAAVHAGEKGRQRLQDLYLSRDAVSCHRTSCAHALCSRQCVRKGPAGSAGLTSPASGAAPGHRAGGNYALCSRQGEEKGQQFRQALHLLRAWRRHRSGCDAVRGGSQCVGEGSAGSARLTPLTSGASPCLRCGGAQRRAAVGAREKGQQDPLAAPACRRRSRTARPVLRTPRSRSCASTSRRR